MNDYEFTLKFRLPAFVADPDQYVEALAAAGCDDDWLASVRTVA